MSDDLSETLKSALGAHAMWKTKLRRSVASKTTDIPIETVRRDDCCILGKLLHHELPAAQRTGEFYTTARDLHRQFHLCAADALTHALAGREPEANALIEGRFSDLSSQLGATLLRWRSKIQ